MDKHAYLIIADNNYKQLKILIELLDYYKNDIYIITDKKSNMFYNKKIKTKFSNIFYLSPIYIYWGSYSLIEAEMILFKESFKRGYSYYHLLSGKDLPLVNQSYIHSFFDKYKGYEFIEYEQSSIKSVKDKIKPHLLRHYYNDGIRNNNSDYSFVIRIFLSIYRRIESLVLLLFFNNSVDYSKIKTASQWVSIDNDLVKFIIKNEKKIYKLFCKGKVVDELFIPTIINSNRKFMSKVYDKHCYDSSPNNPFSNLRYISKRSVDPHPKTFTTNDLNEILSAKDKGYLFARKFDYSTDSNLIKLIVSDINKNYKGEM